LPGRSRQGKRRRPSSPPKTSKKRKEGEVTGDTVGALSIQTKARVIFPRTTKEKIKLKKDDWIGFDEAGQTVTATILGREKVTGRH
jgi:hypothetical protein